MDIEKAIIFGLFSVPPVAVLYLVLKYNIKRLKGE